MTDWRNTENHYGIVAILLHWLMALLIIGLIIFGIYMVRIPISLQKLKLYGWHKEFGFLVLFLGIFRLIWRMGNLIPKLPAHIPKWQQHAARAAHWMFYGFIVVMPITGWLITSAAGLPASFFGWFLLPNLILPNKAMMPFYIFIHQWLGYLMAALIVLHTSAALRHHFIDKDQVLKGILP